MIRFNCTHCGLRIEVDDRFAGKTGSCQQCGKPVTVPELEPNISTGLDSLRDAPDAVPVEFGAYGKAADAGWVDPAAAAAAAAEAARKNAEAEAVPLPDIPAEILAAAKARKKQNMKYVLSALLLALVALVLLLPVLVPKPKASEAPAPIAPAPQFGEPAAQ